ncbi:MAG TPA: efflux RND transporter permease subunit, partial [Spirochaetota bacterium]|nr:efflux RND transporter permease subunit [Spirochaetota bacterium]
MYISDLSVKKPITIFMAIIAISIFGFISLSRLPVDLFPDLEIPVVAVVTDYEGAGPKETEKKITRLIEGTLAGINEIDYINSISREGTSTVMIHFNWGVNLDARTSDVREKLDLIKDALPDSAGTPVIFKFSPSMMPVMMLGLKASPGTDMGALYNMAEDDLKTKLEQVPGIARVTINGGM